MRIAFKIMHWHQLVAVKVHETFILYRKIYLSIGHSDSFNIKAFLGIGMTVYLRGFACETVNAEDGYLMVSP